MVGSFDKYMYEMKKQNTRTYSILAAQLLFTAKDGGTLSATGASPPGLKN